MNQRKWKAGIGITLILTLFVVSCKAIKAKKAEKDQPEVFFRINPQKTYADNIGAIMLHFDLVNNSDSPVVILKPNATFRPRIEFFRNSLECEDIPIWDSAFNNEYKPVSEEDYVTVESKSSVALMMNGRRNGFLACDSDSVQIKIKYEIFKEIKADDPNFQEKTDILNTITNRNIYSENTKFRLRH